ncbi:four helix bundle protein [Empedobacter sp.]|uniref:four helix bundle protein n=1 Tax=Empedobacter sp. TaxID=1927715 RepID=UPI0028B0891A|nr:four helix bundle protein [Empedobacter sp.]
MKTHKDLDVWKLSIEFVTEIYNLTKDFPKEEQFGLTNQIRRASVSIPSNIAEGAGRRSDKEFLQFFIYFYGKYSRDCYAIINFFKFKLFNEIRI